ncbi:MAG TPA: hypothetical protein VK029_09220 [Pseudogracilibacillus sp.]|nr:hypothetical protein [Pseudogracilibacillus sp.]
MSFKMIPFPLEGPAVTSGTLKFPQASVAVTWTDYCHRWIVLRKI